jgi:hypothetical protein
MDSAKGSRRSGLYQPFLDEDERGGDVVLFQRRSWHPWDLLSGHRVTITTHEIRVEAAGLFMCCFAGHTLKANLALADVRDLALQGALWPTIVIYSRHDLHHPALRLRNLRGITPQN